MMQRPKVPFPPLALVEQQFADNGLFDVEKAVQLALDLLPQDSLPRKGDRVAVAVGSRGIHAIDLVVATLCSRLKALGAELFIVPAMGSHGGATVEGQRKVLEGLGIDEQTCGVPINASQGVRELGQRAEGIPVCIDAAAARADHIVPVNRIKAHTKFKGPVESGLLKMLAVGLGGHVGARRLHSQALIHSFPTVIMSAADLILKKAPVTFGLALIENAHGRLHSVEAVPASEISEREPHLLQRAKELAAKLPFDDIDVLIIDRIGKDISGTGMDTNVIGRNRDILGDFTSTPRIKRLVVLGLSEKTAGNGLGIGYADFTTERVVQTIDWNKTYTNALAGISPEKAALPMHFPTDREAIAAALATIGPWSDQTVRLVRIRDTLHLQRLQVSAAMLQGLENARIACNPTDLQFDAQGGLRPFPDS